MSIKNIFIQNKEKLIQEMNSWGHLLQKKVFPKKSRLLSWREMAIFVNLRWRKKIICIDLSVGNSIKDIDTLFFFPERSFYKDFKMPKLFILL